jgi:outer membrane protein
LLDYRSARAQLRATEERLEAARQARDAARRRYELGAATFVEVAQAESGYVAARSARVHAAYSAILARKLIEYHTGSLEEGDTSYDADEDQ